jgi:hypothetical protein
MHARLAFLASFVIACSPRAGSTPAPAEPTALGSTEALTPVWRAASLGVQGEDAAGALRAAFESPIPVVNTARVAASAASCADYFRLKAEGYEPVSDQDFALWRSEGARCQAIQRASRMRPARGDAVEAFLSDAELPRHVPATLGPSVSPDELTARKASESRGQTWSDYAPGTSVERQGDTTVVREPETSSRLRPLASGNLNDDAAPELLVEAVGSGNEGTWVDIRLLVLSCEISADGTLRYRLLEAVSP